MCEPTYNEKLIYKTTRISNQYYSRTYRNFKLYLIAIMKRKTKKTSWIYITLTVFIVAFIISWLLLKKWEISLILATISGVLTFTSNPIRRYMKAFWSVFSLLLTLNSFSLNFILKQVNTNTTGQIEADIGNSSIVLSVSLVILCLFLLLLDFFERNGMPKLGKKVKSDMIINNKKKINKQVNIEKNEGKIEM